jgi:hypothetical protein
MCRLQVVLIVVSIFGLQVGSIWCAQLVMLMLATAIGLSLQRITACKSFVSMLHRWGQFQDNTPSPRLHEAATARKPS